MSESHGSPSDPYRFFFPMGILIGFAGVAIWPLYYFGVTAGYSGRSHAFLQVDGFLYCFIAGFLLTAIPRFTGTETASRRFQWILAAFIIAAAAAFEIQSFRFAHAAFLITHATVVMLAARSFLHRRNPPPETFALVGVAMLTGTLAAIINTLVAWELIDPSWDLLGRRSLTEGMVLMLVLGIGGFLGPRLLGFAALPSVQISSVAPTRPIPLFLTRFRGFLYLVAGAILLAALVAEYGFGINWMSFVRAITATGVIFVTIQPWRPPSTRTTLAWCVWTANLFVVFALWLTAIAPRYRTDFLHVMFMGGFTLLIMAVGMRVTLSHGGHSLAVEKKNWPLRIGLITGLAALLARLGAPFAPSTFFEHLAIAALLWMAGVAAWGWRLVSLIVRGHRPHLQ